MDLKKHVYDNGYCFLGTKKNIVNMIYNNMLEEEEDETYNDLLQEIEEKERDFNLQDNDIVMINYDDYYGYKIVMWQEKDKIEIE